MRLVTVSSHLSLNISARGPRSLLSPAPSLRPSVEDKIIFITILGAGPEFHQFGARSLRGGAN